MFLKTAALPAIVAAVLFFLFGTAPEPWKARIQALIIAFAFFATCFLLTGFPEWPPTGGVAALVYVAFWFALYPWVAPEAPGIRYVLRGIWVLVGSVLVLWPLHNQILENPIHLRNCVALMLLGWGMSSILIRSQQNSHPLTVLVVPMVSIAASSILFVFHGSVLLSQMLTALSVVAGAIAALSWIFPQRISSFGVYNFVAGFFGVCLVTAYMFLDSNPWTLAAMAVPYGVLLLKDLVTAKRASAFKEALIVLIVSVLPIAYLLYSEFKAAGPLY